MQASLVLACPSCGRGNRVPVVRLTEGANCGACHHELRPQGHPLSVDATDLEVLVAHATVPVLVDFWADWCGPCRAMAPQLERFAQSMQRDIIVAKLDTQANPDAARRYQAQAIPLLVLFRQGREIWRDAGARSAAQIERDVRQALMRQRAS